MTARSLGHSANKNGRQLLCRKSARAIFILPGAAGSLGPSQSLICVPFEDEILDFLLDALEAQLVMVPFAVDRFSDNEDDDDDDDDDADDVAIEGVEADRLLIWRRTVLVKLKQYSVDIMDVGEHALTLPPLLSQSLLPPSLAR